MNHTIYIIWANIHPTTQITNLLLQRKYKTCPKKLKNLNSYLGTKISLSVRSERIMACALSGNSCTVTSRRLVFNKYRNEPKKRQSLHLFKVRSSTEDSDCNTEECAPDKEVISLLMPSSAFLHSITRFICVYGVQLYKNNARLKWAWRISEAKRVFYEKSFECGNSRFKFLVKYACSEVVWHFARESGNWYS